jgi:hypothetical protein
LAFLNSVSGCGRLGQIDPPALQHPPDLVLPLAQEVLHTRLIPSFGKDRQHRRACLYSATGYG